MVFQLSRYKLPGARPAPLLGVDISADAIRLIALAKSGKQCQVAHYVCEPLPYGALRDGSIVQFEQVVDALRTALKKSGCRTRNVALAMPSAAVITKTISLPDSLSENELEQQVHAEAGQSLPFSLDEISLDFGVLGPSSNKPGSVDLCLVAARKEKIDERLALAEAAGLKASVMDIESHATRTALAGIIERERAGAAPAVASAAPQAIALFQIGAESSSFSVLQQEVLLYEREASISSQKLEQDLARTGAAPQALLDAFHDQAAQEVARALQLFFNASAHQRIDHLYLAGSSAHVAGLPPILAQKIGFTVTLANPFSGMSVAPAIDEAMLQADASACLVAAGLAMRLAP